MDFHNQTFNREDHSVPSNNQTDQSNHLLLGRVLTDKIITKQVIQNITRKAWRTEEEVFIKEISHNTFSFDFKNADDLNRINKQVTWNIANCPLILKPWLPSQTIQEIEFTNSKFWIQLHGLPRNLLYLNGIRKIGSLIGKVEDCKILATTARILVQINVTQPLRVGMKWWRPEKEDEIWILFRYERLGMVCYNCGKLGHVKERCKSDHLAQVKLKGKFPFNPYGDWIRSENNSWPKIEKEKDCPKDPEHLVLSTHSI